MRLRFHVVYQFQCYLLLVNLFPVGLPGECCAVKVCVCAGVCFGVCSIGQWLTIFLPPHSLWALHQQVRATFKTPLKSVSPCIATPPSFLRDNLNGSDLLPTCTFSCGTPLPLAILLSM